MKCSCGWRHTVATRPADRRGPPRAYAKPADSRQIFMIEQAGTCGKIFQASVTDYENICKYAHKNLPLRAGKTAAAINQLAQNMSSMAGPGYICGHVKS